MNSVFSQIFGLIQRDQQSRTGCILRMIKTVAEMGRCTDEQFVDVIDDFLDSVVGYAFTSGLSPEECEKLFTDFEKPKIGLINRALYALVDAIGGLAHLELTLSETPIPEFHKRVYGLLNECVSYIAVILDLLGEDKTPYQLVYDRFVHRVQYAM